MSSRDAGYAIVMTTTSDSEHANRLAAMIVASRLAACVQIQSITSHYVWKGDTCRENEMLLLAKTKRALYGRLEEFIKNNHSYDTPEILMVPIECGHAPYLRWMDAGTDD